MSRFHVQKRNLSHSYVGFLAVRWRFGLHLDIRHTQKYRKNCLSQIECWNLENEAKTQRKVINLSVNFVVPTSCHLSPYYSLSLSRISSTSHGMYVLGSWRVSAWRNRQIFYHFAAISWYIMIYFMTCQHFIIRRELGALASSPSRLQMRIWRTQ